MASRKCLGVLGPVSMIYHIQRITLLYTIASKNIHYTIMRLRHRNVEYSYTVQ